MWNVIGIFVRDCNIWNNDFDKTLLVFNMWPIHMQSGFNPDISHLMVHLKIV